MPDSHDLITGGNRRLPLDGRSDVAMAYSLRRQSSRYAGPLVRVRRSSDNAERDFYATGGWVDWSAILSFIGAGSGFAATLYDQSGLARDVSQGTAAAQPQIVLASNNRPALLFDGMNDSLFSVAFALNQPWSFNLVYRRLAYLSGSTQNTFDGRTADKGTLYAIQGTTDNKLYANTSWTDNNTTAMPIGTRGAVGGVFNDTASRYEVNAAGIIGSAGTAGASNMDGLTIGGMGGGNAVRYSNIEVQEFVGFAGAHTSAELAARNAAMRAAWGF